MRGSTRWKAITNQTLASGTPGKIEEEQRRRGEERKSMWKGKEEDSEGTQADVQAAIPADSILLFFFFSSLLCSSFLCSSNPSCPPHLQTLSFSVCSDLGAPEEKKQSRKEGEREKGKQPKVKLGIRLMRATGVATVELSLC